MGFKRKGLCVEVGWGGLLQWGSLPVPCKVLDVSEAGVRNESLLFVKNGHALQLVIELEQGRILTLGCKSSTCVPLSSEGRSPRSARRTESDWPISSTITCRPAFHAGSRSALEHMAGRVRSQLCLRQIDVRQVGPAH